MNFKLLKLFKCNNNYLKRKYTFCPYLAKSLRRSLSADGSLSESLNSDDLMLDVDYEPTDDNNVIESDNNDLLKTLENNKQNAFDEWTSLTSPRYLNNN